MSRQRVPMLARGKLKRAFIGTVRKASGVSPVPPLLHDLILGEGGGIRSDHISTKPYFDFLVASISRFSGHQEASLQPYLLQSPQACLTTVQCLLFVFTRAGPRTTLSDLVEQLELRMRVWSGSPPLHSRQTTNLLFEFAFVSLGLCTGLYNTNEWRGINSGSYALDRPDEYELVENLPRRPLAVLLRGIRAWPAKITIRANTATSNTELQQRTIRPRNLHFHHMRNIGGLSIRWSSDLLQHLTFDETARQITLFRFPSYCIVVRENENSLFSKLFAFLGDKENNPWGDSLLDAAAFLQEVLLSYRILFGQDPASRRLFSNRERRRLRELGEIDPLLNYLCTNRTLRDPSVRDIVFDEDVYTVGNDFVVLGERLLVLQRYMAQLDPGGIRQLWQDRRSPLQWFTFWAVLILGCLSLLLSLVQTIFSILQVVIALRE